MVYSLHMNSCTKKKEEMNMTKKMTAVAAVVFSAGLAAGGMVAGAQETEAALSAVEAETEAALTAVETEADTGDASLDNSRNQDGIGEKELLVVSFGTSFNDSRRKTIGAIEDTLENAFPEYSVRRAFTSQIIIDHVYERDGYLIDDVDTALGRAIDNGVKELVVQPTHLMSGYEYTDLYDQVAEYSDAFESVRIGEPLLSCDADMASVEEVLVDWTKEYDDGKTAIVFMGHGTEADSNGVYQKMQDILDQDGHANYYIGTVEATPSLEDVIGKVKEGSYERVILEPMMVVAGDHANNDMAGDEEGSWKRAFEEEGYEVECLLRGLGENEDIRSLYVEHVETALDD
jgi:sirohydrochlorin cobaltochelatase